MPEKKFKLTAAQLKPLVEKTGWCIATDQITVEGRKVGYMYREQPDKEGDSGWRFFSGEEDQEYVDDASHMEMYHLNTIANYDSAIIPHLDAPFGKAFGRVDGTDRFREEPVAPPEE